MDQSPRASIHFPIEGRSPWVLILRMIALGSIGALVTVAVLLFMFHDHADNIPVILSGLVGFLLMEYLIMRAVIVPRLADYGRFRVYQDKVDFFPLGLTGLTVSEASDSEPITAFSGLTVRAEPEKGRYRVLLLHKQPGRSICVKSYSAPEPAIGHAEALALTMDVGYMRYKNKQQAA